MPTKAPPRKTAAKATPAKATEEPTLLDQTDAMPEFLVDDLKVVDTKRIQNLPNGVATNANTLTLEDGSRRYQCVDCPNVIGSRDDIRVHRRNVHPTNIGHKSRGPGRMGAIMSLNLGQLVEQAEAAMSAGEFIERIEAERDDYRSQLMELTRRHSNLLRRLEKAGFTLKEDE